jgi:tRNA pseudouridine55 synthase
VSGEPKVYEATIRFGAETTTDDRTGEVTRTAPPPIPHRVDDAIPLLTGEIDQLPPAFSAKQVGGERAYDAARRGEPLDLRPARVRVFSWTIERRTETELVATISCGGGTYIRSLARDLGRLTDSAAHLAELRRVRSGPYSVADAIPADSLAHAPVHLRPVLDALGEIPVHVADEAETLRISRGQPLDATAAAPRAALVDADRNVLAVAERVGRQWHPRVVLVGD